MLPAGRPSSRGTRGRAAWPPWRRGSGRPRPDPSGHAAAWRPSRPWPRRAPRRSRESCRRGRRPSGCPHKVRSAQEHVPSPPAALPSREGVHGTDDIAASQKGEPRLLHRVGAVLVGHELEFGQEPAEVTDWRWNVPHHPVRTREVVFWAQKIRRRKNRSRSRHGGRGSGPRREGYGSTGQAAVTSRSRRRRSRLANVLTARAGLRPATWASHASCTASSRSAWGTRPNSASRYAS